MTPPQNPWDRSGPPPRPGGRWRLWLWLAGLAAMLVLFWLVYNGGPAMSDLGQDWPRLIYLLLILGLVVGNYMLSRELRWTTALRYAGIWIAIASLLLLGYSARYELEWMGRRMLGTLLPHQPMDTAAGAVEIRRGAGGHFRVVGEVNGVPVRFLIDTGASTIVLTQADATRAGLRPDTLAYTQIFNTANGRVRGAPVRLDRIAIGSIVFRDIRASVNGGEMDQSLLGMSFLGRLSAVSVEGERLTLHP